MMSQLMLLNASSQGGGAKSSKKCSGKIQEQQAEIMHNIQKLIDKPIVIQAEGSVELSHGSFKQVMQP